jgi:hypothetical protein
MWGEEECLKDFGGKPRSKEIRWEDIKMDLEEVGWGGMDWSHLAQDRNQWRALMNMITNFRFHKMLGTSEIAKQEIFSSTELESLFVGWLTGWLVS